MRLTGLAAMLLVGSALLAGCSDSATCDDVDDLTAQLEETSPEDPEYNDILGDLRLAEADCNSSGTDQPVM